MKPEWEKRPDLKWCPECGPNANIESIERPVGTRYTCLTCGAYFPFYGEIPLAERP